MRGLSDSKLIAHTADRVDRATSDTLLSGSALKLAACCGQGHLSWCAPLAWLVRDLLLPIIWLKGWLSSTYAWRGDVVVIHVVAELSRQQHLANSNHARRPRCHDSFVKSS